MTYSVRTILLGCTALSVLALSTAAANAGGFALREQSTAGQGASFAGVAAGGALSSMFWNPAVMTQYNGTGFELGATAILPKASQSYTTSTLAGINPAYAQGVSNSGDSAFVPNAYVSYQLAPQWWVGMSINSPFGLSVSFPQFWAGSAYAQSTSLKTFNFAPAVAFKVNDWISLAFGAQIQYATVGFANLASPTGQNANVGGTGFGYGYTAGVTITPTRTTNIGIGYRSAINQSINGSLNSPVAGSTIGSVNATVNLPGTFTVGLRQGIADRFTLLAGFEWANWSRIGTTTVFSAAGQAAIGGVPVAFPFQYSDSYFYSLGGEYAVNPNWTLRAGIAFEKSPITDGVRTPRLPDNDRIWYSIGSSYKPPQFSGVTFDLGYSYIDVKNAPVCLGPAAAGGCPSNPWSGAALAYVGSVSSSIHILSASVRVQFEPGRR